MPLEQHQRDALEAAYELLREHFDSSLISVSTSNSNGKESTEVYWAGGYITAIGLAYHSARSIENVKEDSNDPSRQQEGET